MNETVRFIGRSAEPHAIKIGNELENLAQSIKFELPHDFKYASVFLHIQFGYYADVVNLGDDRIFKPTRTHTQKPGRYTAYIEALIDGDVVWKSDVFYLHVGALPDDGALIEKKYPTAFEEALQAVATLTGIQVKAETLPEGAEATVLLDKDENGQPVLVYGIPTGPKGDPGYTPVKGKDYFDGKAGYSPTVKISAISGGHRVEITDATGTHAFDVMDGSNGGGGGSAEVPEIILTQTDNGYTLAIKSSSGMQVVELVNGRDGAGASVSTEVISGGHRVTITGANGPKTFDVMDGATPQRGTDYWTDADKAEIKSYVDEAILGGEW